MDAQSAPLQGKSRRFTIAHHPRRRSKMFCPKCCRSLPPPAISRLEGTLFGHGFQAWAIYQRVVLRLSYRLITATMEDMFGERTSPTTVVNFVRSLADLYGPCEKANLDRLLASVRDLLVPMIEAVQGRATKARQLAKFLPSVDAFSGCNERFPSTSLFLLSRACLTL